MPTRAGVADNGTGNHVAPVQLPDNYFTAVVLPTDVETAVAVEIAGALLVPARSRIAETAAADHARAVQLPDTSLAGVILPQNIRFAVAVEVGGREVHRDRCRGGAAVADACLDRDRVRPGIFSRSCKVARSVLTWLSEPTIVSFVVPEPVIPLPVADSRPCRSSSVTVKIRLCGPPAAPAVSAARPVVSASVSAKAALS